MAVGATRKYDSGAAHTTKSLAKLIAVAVLLIATIIVVYVAS